MNSVKLNDRLQVIGIFAVVASLIFVGLQMRQDQQIAIAGQYQQRYAVAMDFWTSREASPIQVKVVGQQLIARFGLPHGTSDTIAASELGSRFLYVRATLGIYDNQHFQYEMGLLPLEAWQPYENALRGLLNRDDQLASYILEHYRDQYRESFVELCDSLVARSS